MILEIQQIETGANKTYKCYRNGETICDVTIPYDATQRVFYFDFMNRTNDIELHFIPKDMLHKAGVVTKCVKPIICDGENIGCIRHTKRYGLFEIEYYGETYLVYNIDDEEGCCQVIKDLNDNIVAEIEHIKKHYTHKDKYVAYTRKENFADLLCILAIHIDFVEYGETRSNEAFSTNGYRKPHAVKFIDEDFMDAIALEEGFDRNKPQAIVKTSASEIDFVPGYKKRQKSSKMKLLLWFLILVVGTFILRQLI